MGSKDALRDSEKITARLQNQLPCVKAVIIPGGGHALMSTTEYILQFLSNET
jgi:glutamine amidotransferase PdxT